MRRVVTAVRRVLVVPEPDLVARQRASLVIAVAMGLGILALLFAPVVTVLPYAEATVVTLLVASVLSFAAAAVARRGHVDLASFALIVMLFAVLVVPSVHGRDGSYAPMFMAGFVAIAGALCEDVRRAVAGLDLGRRAPGLAVTVSIGVTHVDRPTDPEELVLAADRLLYRAKVAGKNRVVADGEQVAVAGAR